MDSTRRLFQGFLALGGLLLRVASMSNLLFGRIARGDLGSSGHCLAAESLR